MASARSEAYEAFLKQPAPGRDRSDGMSHKDGKISAGDFHGKSGSSVVITPGGDAATTEAGFHPEPVARRSDVPGGVLSFDDASAPVSSTVATKRAHGPVVPASGLHRRVPRVLVLVDGAPSDALVEQLSDAGYIADVPDTDVFALELDGFNGERLDAAIVEVTPGGEGIALCSQLRDVCAALPIVAMVPVDANDARREVRAAGADAVVPSAWTDDLPHALATAIAARRARGDRTIPRRADNPVPAIERNAEPATLGSTPVVIVTDDVERAHAAANALRDGGIAVAIAAEPGAAPTQFAQAIVTLGEGLQGALDVCRRVASGAVCASIIFFGAADGPGPALEAGADRFWSDDWDVGLLPLQVRTSAARAGAAPAGDERVARFAIRSPFGEPEFYRRGRRIQLGKDELSLAMLLLQNVGRIVSWEAVADLVWPGYRDLRDVREKRRDLVRRIRKKLGADRVILVTASGGVYFKREACESV